MTRLSGRLLSFVCRLHEEAGRQPTDFATGRIPTQKEVCDLPLRELNSDCWIQSPKCYHYTKEQQHSRAAKNLRILLS